MDGSIFYGLKGRVISGIVGFAGVFAAAVSAAQQANLISILPPQYNKYLSAAAIISLCITLFSERLQGGASKPEVRQAAANSDAKNDLEAMNR